MEKKDYENFTNRCIMGERAPCSVCCPLNLDIPKIAKNIQLGDFSAAYRKYRDQSVFPAIVSEICSQPCLSGCVRKDKDDSISLLLLEKACVEFTSSNEPPRFNLPKKGKKIIIVGGGLAGLACGQKLGTKGYEVIIYEKSNTLGGRLESLLDRELYLPEIERQMQFANCEIRYNTEILSLDEIEYDAAYIATGENGGNYGLLKDYDKKSFSTTLEGVFIGGAILNATPVEDIGQAIVASHSIEKYIKLKKADGIPETFIVTDSPIVKKLDRENFKPRIIPVNGKKYDKNEAALEANRCILCDCTECRDACELFDYFRKTPKQINGEAIASLHSKAGISRQMATRIVASCNLCGLCGKVCPEEIDIGQLAYDFRYFISQSKTFPPAYSDFYIRDMIFSNNEAALSRLAPGYESAKLMFFPGCQLGASNPEYVLKAYSGLLDKEPSTAIMLNCCGAPADWGTKKKLNQQTINEIKKTWEKFGQPEIVFACPTCQRQLTTYLPEAKTISLYELLKEPRSDLRKKEGKLNENVKRVCIFDPCASRDNKELQNAVRRIVTASGLELDELYYSEEKARCCGWGGHIQGANPVLADRMINNRINSHTNPYITYCTNCRDTFVWKGKECVHVLDLILDISKKEYSPPSLGTRRKNKLRTKNTLLRDFFKETFSEEGEDEFLMDLEISNEMIKKLNSLLILEEEIAETIQYCENTGNSFFDPNKNCNIGNHKIGLITYWVEYQKQENKIKLINAYSHRVEILED